MKNGRIMNFFNKTINKLFEGDKKTVAVNYFSLLVLQGTNYILPLLTLPFLVRVLGAEKFGLVMFAQALATFLSVLVDFGFNLSGTREVSLARHQKEELSKIFSAILIIKVVLCIVALTLLFVIINLFDRFSVEPNVYYLSFGVVIGQALFPIWFFQGIEKMKFVTTVNILAKVIFTVLVFVLIRQESDYISVPTYNSLGFIVAGIVGLFLSLKYVSFTWPGFKTIRRLVVESSSLFVSSFAISLYTSSNALILGLFTGDIIVGVYSSMEKLVLAIKNIYSPLYQALYPWLSKQADLKKVNIINKLKPVIFSLGFLVIMVIIFFGRTILDQIFDDEVISSYSIIFKILSFTAMFSGLNMLYNTLFFPAIKKYKIRMNILIFGGLFSLLLSLILVKYFGIFGTAYTVISTELLLLILGLYFFKKQASKITLESTLE